METLEHNGILVIAPPPYLALSIIVRGSEVQLTHLQEEMALAWVKKLGTPYVEDPIFEKNFMTDFSKALGVSPVLRAEEVDFTEVIDVVEQARK